MNSFLNTNAELIITLVKIGLLLFIVLTVNAYLTWFERKVVAHIQSRWGPHRVGPHGLLQPLADGLKFLFKEDPTPAGVDKFVYYLAPLLALALALTAIALIPFGPDPVRLFGHDIYLGIAPPDVNIGILALFAITAMGVYGVALAGWSSNSKYPLLGGLRSSAQMISYELSLTMSVVGVLLLAGSFNLKKIIEAQSHHPEWGLFGWNVWPQILVAGFHTEYSSFKFAMFFIAEYTSMITVSCLCSILFFGGWLSPFPASWTYAHYFPSAILISFGLWVIWDGIRYETLFGRIILPGAGTIITALGALFVLRPDVNEFIQAPFWLLSKIFGFLFVYVWMRGTLPRFRYDQLMAFGWKLLLPLSIVNVIVTSFAILAKMQWWGAK